MPKLMISTGTGDTPETALLNARGTLAGPLNEAADSQMISQTVEQTPNGFVVTLQVALFDEEELGAPEEGRDGRGEGDKENGLQPERAKHVNVTELAYILSQRQLKRDRDLFHDQTAQIMAQTTPVPDNLPADFEEAAHPAPDNDNHASGNQSGQHIRTHLETREIDSAVSHEMLSSDTVAWEPANAAPAPAPEMEFEEVVMPNGERVRVAKQRPGELSPDLVA